jgi:WD40 repeat protein
MPKSEVSLSRSNVSRMQPKKTFSKHKSPINSMEFSADGTKIVTTAENNFISVYDVEEGCVDKVINSNIYGAGHVCWGAHREIILVSSTLKDNHVRYLSLYDNKYVRVFSGHEEKVTDMVLSAERDQLLTCSDDKNFRVFDIRVNECTHIMKCGATPIVAIDPEGLVIAVGLESTTMRLYDFRNLTAGPFEKFPFDSPPARTWTKLKFSPLGNQVMVNTNTPTVMLIEAFSASYNYILNSNDVIPGLHEVKGSFFSDYSMDERFLFTGGPNGVVSVFETKDGNKFTELKSKHRGHVTHTLFNPLYRVMATASDELVSCF